jgi:hypothetical protein
MPEFIEAGTPSVSQAGTVGIAAVNEYRLMSDGN